MFVAGFVQISEESTMTMETGYRPELRRASRNTVKSSRALWF